MILLKDSGGVIEMLKKIKENLFLMKDDKFKHNSYCFYFLLDYNLDVFLSLEIFKNLIGKATKKYAEKRDMVNAIDNLYNISIFSSNRIFCQKILFTIQFNFLKTKYSNLELMEYEEFIKEVIFNTVVEEKNFLEEKNIFLDVLARNMEDPVSLAIENAKKIFRNSDTFYLYKKDYSEELKKFSYQTFLKNYNKIYTDSNFKLFVHGDVSEIKLEDFFGSLKIGNKEINLLGKNDNLPIKEEIFEDFNSNQSVVLMFYNCPYDFKHKDYIKWIVAQSLFGKGYTSLLFSEVREKNSLCYNVSSHEYIDLGIVFVYSLIDKKNYESFKKIVNEQINVIIEQKYSDDVLQRVKKAMIQDILKIQDGNSEILHSFYYKTLFKHNLDYRDIISKINDVTKEDISKIISSYSLCFSYLLKGVKNV